MSRKRLVVELGMGVDLHGKNYTKAAVRAVENAVRGGSLLYLGEIYKETGKFPKVYVDVIIGAPEPELVDKDEVLKSLPLGEKTIKVVPGGLSIEHTQPDNIVIANASVLVQVETE